MLDDDNTIMKKIKSAVTDSEARVYRKDGKDGVNNLMGIYSCCTGKSDEEIEKEFDGKGYGDFKNAVGEAVCDELPSSEGGIQPPYKRQGLSRGMHEGGRRKSLLHRGTHSQKSNEKGWIFADLKYIRQKRIEQ